MNAYVILSARWWPVRAEAIESWLGAEGHPLPEGARNLARDGAQRSPGTEGKKRCKPCRGDGIETGIRLSESAGSAVAFNQTSRITK